MSDETKPCPDCSGTGEVVISRANNDGGIAHDEIIDDCETCNGTGNVREGDEEEE